MSNASGPTLRLGTRGSKLALVQAHYVKSRFHQAGVDLEIVPIKTSGDKGNRDELGAFVREIQRQILDGAVDLGLHCLKDIPTTDLPGLHFSAYLSREDPRDAILTRSGLWEDLPAGSTVGTGSLRRTSQLAAIRPDLQFKRLVGNVDTRLHKLEEGEYDAIVLAAVGLSRLGLLGEWPYETAFPQILDTEAMVPAPGQAVLVLEARQGESHGEFLHDATVQSASTAERSFLKRFGGGCSVPVGAYASVEGDSLTLLGLVASADGTEVFRGQIRGTASQAASLGEELAERLGRQGGFRVVDSVLAVRLVAQ